MFLYERVEGWRDVIDAEVPDYISKNLNPAFELRDYQIKAFENFIMYFENKKSPRPLQVLFHMATGSGKTLIMAGLILYLYKQGYRNFLFFVNLTNILDKTRENFLKATSSKYLFADEIFIDGEKIKINLVENFQSTDENAINICFETTQALHTDVFFRKENKVTEYDFDDKKIVLISDEAHHLNVYTKNGVNAKDENYKSWEQTVTFLFKKNPENILLEFTATCDLSNADIKNFYEDKIIFSYPLKDFCEEKYSKSIMNLRSDFPIMERALQALILSQYRLKLFHDHRLNIKPVILFKSKTIAESRNFKKEFLDAVKNLDGEYLEKLSEEFTAPIMKRAFEYFSRKGIEFEMLAAELRDDFSESHCISANEDNDVENNQILLNSLEDADNPYRAIFEVKKLDEGWDVLNLFDIVRLYETRQSGGKKISSTTISEAQLIGRGSRYCPFKIDDEQPKFQRKYDSDADCELRICETLYYHCQNDSRYISELQAALKERGLQFDKNISRSYILKDSFKNDDFYKYGVIFLNERTEKKVPPMSELPVTIREKIYFVTVSAGKSDSGNLMTDEQITDKQIEVYTFRKNFSEINFAIVCKALRKYPIFKFCSLKKIFPNLTSTKEFITDKNFLRDIQIDIKCNTEKLSVGVLYKAVCDVLKEIADKLSLPKKEFEGTKKFTARNINEIFVDKTVTYSETHDNGIGVSQNDSSVAQNLKIDLSSEDWFAHTDHFGTSEEKALVAYFRDHINELKKHYAKIFLVRNERQFKIYDFKTGDAFEPDFVLFLQKKNSSTIEHRQIFIEPKGEHLETKDTWKEKFLLELKETAETKNLYEVQGFHFFNKEKITDFDKDFKTLY